MGDETGRITRLWLTVIEVSQLEEALRFYHDVLGMPIALEVKAFNHAEVGPEEPMAKIGLHATGEKNREPRSTGIVLETDDIYALYDRLKTEGVTFTQEPTKMPWGAIAANFLDPDKNELEVVQDPDHYSRSYG